MAYDPWYEFWKGLTGAGDNQWKWIADLFGMSQKDIDGAQNAWRYTMSGVPLFGWPYQYMDAVKYMSDYFKNRNMSWSDMEYPSRAPGAGVFGSGINFLSNNILRLYESDEREKLRRYENIRNKYRAGYYYH